MSLDTASPTAAVVPAAPSPDWRTWGVPGAGLVALLGLNALITAGILGLANVLPGYLAAIIIAVVLFLVAGVLALLGKKDVQDAKPPLPTETLESIKTDVATVKESAGR